MSTNHAAQRTQALLLSCLSQLEYYMEQGRREDVPPEDFPEWDSLFGAKENVVSVLSKLVNMQKTVLELRAREEERASEDASMPMNDEDWELLALCVDRWRERKEAENMDASAE